MTRISRIKNASDSIAIPYKVARGDVLLQDVLFTPEVIQRGLKMLSKYGGDLAYTPEMNERFNTILQRRFDTNIGFEIFEMPNYGVYEDPEMAAFYGADTSQRDNLQTRLETYDEQIDRLLHETVCELEAELDGLSQMMNLYKLEEWGRYGVAAEMPYNHIDPDLTLLRNPQRGWNALDIAAATSEKSNVISNYQGIPENVFATPHEGWLVDQKDRYWDQLEDNPKSSKIKPYGFY